MRALIISSSPHIHSAINTSRLMMHVIIALLPASIAGMVLFGWLRVLPIILVAVGTAVFSEWVLQKILHIQNSLNDASAALTGLLLALTLSPMTPWWIVAIGAFIAILSKQVFGGMGQNIFNPALIGRAFIVISWPIQNSQWIKPFAGQDITTSATPLQVWSMQGMQVVVDQFGGSLSSLYRNLLLGLHGGCIGEVFIPALLFGLIYLIATKVISWRIPLSYVLSVAILSLVLKVDPIASLLSGGLLFGAFFMATDYVTSPLLPKNQLIFGASIGLINVLIRVFTPMPEGVTFAILIMNMLVPLMDRKVRNPIGWEAAKKVQG
jgi:Na+-translocating ferredoxin:NAD+ oxidoreductase subunit D